MFFAALQNYTFQLSQLANLQSAVFFQSKVVFSFLSFHYFRQHVNINIKTGALKLSSELLGMIQNHDLVKHKKNLQRNYLYTYLTCVANAFCFMSIRVHLTYALKIYVYQINMLHWN